MNSIVTENNYATSVVKSILHNLVFCFSSLSLCFYSHVNKEFIHWKRSKERMKLIIQFVSKSFPHVAVHIIFVED